LKKSLIIFIATALIISTINIYSQTPEKLNDGLLVSTPSSVGLSEKLLSKLDSTIQSGEVHNVTSVLISRNGKLVFEKYYDGFNKNSLHDTRSATKSITGTLIGIAIDKNYILSEQQSIVKYFEDEKPFENPDPRKDSITVEDLLTMSSMMECNDENQFSRGNEERMYLIEDYFKFFLDLPIRGIPPWETPPAESPYGRNFSYCTAGVVLLGGIVQRSTHMPLENFAKKYLFSPLGINKVQWQITPMGIPMTGGGLRITSRDYIKLGELYNSGGMWKGNQIISKEWINKSIKTHVQARENTNYGYLFWIQKFGKGQKMYSAYYMAGNGGTKIAMFPDLNMVVVTTANWYGTRKAHMQSEKILNEYIIPAVN
jgi:CubicO group peptidase (beta-lactamase class C family)